MDHRLLDLLRMFSLFRATSKFLEIIHHKVKLHQPIPVRTHVMELHYLTSKRAQEKPKELYVAPKYQLVRRISFLSCPREVRDMIYQLVLISDTPIRIRSASRWKVPVTISICFANRQLWLETAEIFYSQNTFVFSTPSGMRTFERNIGWTKAAFLKSIEIETQLSLWQNKFCQGWDPVWLRTFRASIMNNLERITVTIAHCRFWAEVVVFSGLRDAIGRYWMRGDEMPVFKVL